MSDTEQPTTDQPEENEPLRIDPQINAKVNTFRSIANNLRNEIGQLEIRKFQLLNQIAGIERQARELVNHEVERLGIPADAQWGLQEDGTVKIAPSQPGAPQAAPPAEG